MSKEEYDYKADYRCDTMEMLDIFTKSQINREIGVPPSVYVRELYMPSAERQLFLNLNNECIKLFPNSSTNDLIEKWDVKPRIVFFSKWCPGEEYETLFTVRNRYRTSKLVKLTLKDSPVFELEKLVSFNRLGSMVTFGYKVKFRPQNLIDYHDVIKLEAENETLEIYVLAVAPRPLIDFPDRIDFGNVLVNFNNIKQIRLENISTIPAEASLSTEGIFTLDQSKLLLNPNETVILKIFLNHREKREVKDKLLVTYDSGEKLYINLCATCYTGDIYFEEKNVINLGSLYVGLRSTSTVTLINETDELLSYIWLNNRNFKVDELELEVLGYTLAEISKLNCSKTAGMKYYGMIADETHEKIIDKVYNEEFKNKNHHYFSDENYEIQPLIGKISPRSKQTFVITFKPVYVKKIRKRAYLEINGLSDRRRLALRGEGIGPDIIMNVSTIDFEQIFICSEHTYLVTVKNIGLVKGTIHYAENTKLSFGETIKCVPLKQEVLPGEVKHFEICVASAVAGSFVEDVWFRIEESEKKIKCTMKGHIINPRLTLNKKVIDFGAVSLGFKHNSSFVITNESPIPVEYKIEVVGDGFMPAMEINTYFELTLPSHPKEFTIVPEKDEILPSHSRTVEISLISNIIREHTTVLKIYLWEVLVEECSLTLKYNSVTPIITCKPSEILLRYAFIDYDYTHEIILYNGHYLPAFFALVPQEEIDNDSTPGLIYNLDVYSDYLPPNSSKVVNIEIRVLSLTPITEKINLKVFGITNPIDFCTIRAFGMGPVVNPSTFIMPWGRIPVLQSIEKMLYLINVSPIYAFFKICVEKYPEIWTLSLTEGSIEPESEVEIIVTVNLRDSGAIEDRLLTEIVGSRDINVSISAEGFGCSIVTEPNLFPEYNIGKVFRKEKHDDIIKVTNAGTRHHTIVFTTMKVIKNLTKVKADQEQGIYFKLIPYKLDLEGGQTQEMHLIYEWDKIEVLEDTYYCYAIIERRGKRVPLGSCTIKASFTDTELTFQPTSLNFRVDVPTLLTPILPQCKTLTVFSRWSYTLFLECTLKKPFVFKNINGKNTSDDSTFSLELEPEESQSFDVEFDPMYISDRYSRVCSGYLIVTFRGHKVKACVPVRGEVNFPNIEISTHEINFGCIVPNTEGLQHAILTNSTPLSIEFEWFWSEQKLFELKSPFVETNSIESSNVPEEVSSEDAATSENEINDKDKKKSDENSYESINEFGSEEIVGEIPTIDSSLNSQVSDISSEKMFFFDDEEGNEEEVNTDFSSEDIEESSQETELQCNVLDKKSSSETVIIDPSCSHSSLTSEFSFSEETIKTADTNSSNEKSEDLPNINEYLNQETIVQIPEMNDKYKKKKNDENYYESINEFGVKEIMGKIPNTINRSVISQVFDIIPAKSKLNPHDTLQVTFIYSPTKTMKIKGKALLKVSGGPEETVNFKGCCYPVLYEIIPPKINFGFGPFCELWCSSFFVWNKGLKKIHVCVNVPEYYSQTQHTEVVSLLPENIGLSPMASYIPPNEVAYYKIAVLPGKIGEIAKEFTLQVDDLPPVTVDLKGYALPHQVHLALPRTIKPLLMEEMYISLGSLTSQWFSFVEGSNHEDFKTIEKEIDGPYSIMEGERWDMMSKDGSNHEDFNNIEEEINEPYTIEEEIDEPYTIEEEIDEPYTIEEEIDKPYTIEEEIDKPYTIEEEIDKPYTIEEEIDKPSSIMENERWDMMPKDDFTPNIDDMNMAYERYMCELFAMQYTGNMPHTSSLLGHDVFSEFVVPPYNLDFGSIITNTRAQCLVVFSNYCPMETVVKINFPENSDELLDRYGLFLKPHCSTILPPFGKKQLAILLRPPHNALSPLVFEENLTFNFDFRVTCGPVIPVTVKASITQPYLCTPAHFDFGLIKVGYKRIIKCFVRNQNKIDCEWFAFIRPLRVHGFSQPNFNEQLCPFTVKPVYGYAKPKSKFLLSIGFEPKKEEVYEVILQFIINMNPQSVAIRLKGCGMKPHINAKNINLGYSIPYSKPITGTITIQNPCLFPLQVFIQETQKEYFTEQDLFNYLLRYYRKDKICIPSTYYRNRPGKKILLMFKRLVKKSIEKFLEDAMEFLNLICVGCHEIKESLVPEVSDINQSKLKIGGRSQITSRKNKRRINAHKYKQNDEISKEFASFNSAIIENNFQIKPLEDIINDYIKYVTLMDLKPSNLSLPEKPLINNDEPKFECGNVLFIYGSPKSNSDIFVGKISHYCKMDTISLDWEIITDLSENSCIDENQSIRDSIEKYFNEHIKDIDETIYGEECNDQDPTETLENIISLVANHFFINLKMKEETKTKVQFKPKKKNGLVIQHDTLLNLPALNFQKIIKRRLGSKVKNGIIFNNLKSKFFSNPVSTLKVLLDIFKRSTNVKVISLCTDAERSIHNTEENPPNLYLIQAFCNLRNLEYFALPESTREMIADEINNFRKSPTTSSDEADVVTEKNKEVTPPKQSSKLETPKSIVKGNVMSDKKITKARKSKYKNLSPENLMPSGAEIKIGTYPDPTTAEYFENLIKIYQLLEKYQRIEKINNPSSRLSKIKLEEVSNEILKKKAKLMEDEDIGIPLWILFSNPDYIDNQFDQYIPLVTSWKDDSLNSRSTAREYSNLKMKLKNHNYFVIKNNVEQCKPNLTDWENECRLFKLVNDECKVPSSSVIMTLLSISKSKSTAKLRKKKKSEIREEIDKGPLVQEMLKKMEAVYLEELDERLKSLWSKFNSGININPEDSVQYDVIFSPKGFSTYKQDFHIGIGGCDTLGKVTVFGACDIPDILFHPCYVFSDMLYANADDATIVVEPGFNIIKKSYHFGTILIGNSEDKSLFQVRSTLKLKNYTALDVKLSICIYDEKLETDEKNLEEQHSKQDVEIIKEFLKKHNMNIPTNFPILSPPKIKRSKVHASIRSCELLSLLHVFDFESPELYIEAGGEKTFVISAYPTQAGLYSCKYVFSVENNPKVHVLKAYCYGTEPKVVFTPNQLLFDDVILYRQISLPFNMTNTCKLPLSWRVINADSLKSKLLLSRVSGNLKPKEVEVVFISYHPKEVQEIREQLIIHVFDQEGKGRVLLDHKYHLHLRSYDVQVEVYFELSGGNSIDFHDLIVMQRVPAEFYIKNKGYSDILASITFNKDLSSLHKQIDVVLNDDFTIIKTQSLFQTELSITCLEEIKLENAPLLNIEIIDNLYKETIANIPLYMSLQSHYSRFTLSPTHNLDFGNLAVDELKCLQITITNCGFIDFKYRFVPEKKLSNDENIFLDNRKLSTIKINPFLRKQKQKKKYGMLKRHFDKKNFNSKLSKNISNVIFMNKFLQQLKYQEMKHNYLKKRKFLNYLCKISYLRKWKLNFSWTSANLLDLKNVYSYTDLACVRTIKNLWNLKQLDNIILSKKVFYEQKKTNQPSNIQAEFDMYRKKELKCYIPPFRIVPAIGKIRIGHKMDIKVHCNPLNEGTFQETVNLFVTNSLPNLKNGFPIQLSVESSLPKVNFEDYSSMFRELETVDKWSEYDHHVNDGKPYEIFCIEDKSLTFFNVVIGANRTITVYLQSENQIEASVLITLSGLEDGSDMCPFSLDKTDDVVVYIKPYGSSSFRINFSPNCLEEKRATITMSLEIPDLFKKQWWHSSITLIGKGNFPCILVKEIDLGQENFGMIDFGTMLIGFSEKKTFFLENRGIIAAELILEVVYNQDVFMIHTLENSLKYVEEELNGDNIGQTKIIIPPGEKGQFEVEFKPKEFMSYSSRINIHILYNPFEFIFINIYGSGFIGNVVIEGLKLTKGEPLTFSGDITAEYFLNFGFCIVGKKYSEEFSLINNCINLIRYTFDVYHGVMFVPNVGHIYPGSKKNIVAIINKLVAMEFRETVQCYYEEIAYKQDTPYEDWDNTLKSVKWTKTEGQTITSENIGNASMLKIEKVSDEPEFSVIKTENNYLPIIVSAVFDTPRLKIVTESINFPDVIVSQSFESEALITNVSNCNASFTITIYDEKIETPDSVPEVSDFSFGKFGYNLNQLPEHSEAILFTIEQLSTSPNYQKTDLWKELRRKHLEILYGKSVIVIPRKQIVPSKESKKRRSSIIGLKTPKKSRWLKISKQQKSGIDAKKGLLQRNASKALPLKTTKESKLNVANVRDVPLHATTAIKTTSKSSGSSRRSIISEIQFSELVKIGHTYLLLPTDLPKTVVKHPLKPDSQCFTVNTSSITLKPNETFRCPVKFIPKHIHRYEAEMRIFNMETEECSFIKLNGLGILPLCHIEIDEDNYLNEKKPIITHIPSGTKVITVVSIFKETYLNKNFKVFNIAEIPYNFKWININNSCPSAKSIKFLMAEGIIPTRGSYEMEFSFFPMDYGIYESLWLLQIKEFFLEQPILIVFKIRKPMISFEPTTVVFEPTLKGFKRTCSVKLLNKEEFSFKYSVNEDSLFSGDKNNKSLYVNPMIGTVGPKNEEKLIIEYTPQCTTDVMFTIRTEMHSDLNHLKFQISPLKVLSKCYSVEPKISCQKEDNTKIDLLAAEKKSANFIKIGKLLIRIPYTLKFFISNTGEIPLYFEVFLSEENHKETMSVELIGKSGVIHSMETNSFTVTLIANRKVDFRELIIIKICKGPYFQAWLSGTAAEPVYELSPASFDFGICLIDKRNYKKYSKILEFSNLDTDFILLEKMDENIEGFNVNFSSLTIEPRAVHKIIIGFCPIANQVYSAKLHFLVNGIYKHEINLVGEGESFKLELDDPKSIIIDFGLVMARELISKEIPVINKSRLPVNFILKSSQKRSKGDFQLKIDTLNKEMDLLPGQVGIVKVYVYGKERIQNCTCNIMYDGYGSSETLFIVRGTIIDYKFELDQKSILFDTTIIGCPNTKKVGLINSGDIGSRFKIETRFTSDVFAIKPVEGYCPPNSKTIIEICFMANFITKYCNNMLICLIENHETLTLNITGIGAKLPPPIDVIRFKTNVRTKASEFLILNNRSYEEQTLYPVLSGEYFSVNDAIKIPANSSAECKIYYHPLTMTTTQFHMGHFFCGFPSGEVMFYQLIGQSTAPITHKSFWECKAKKKFVGQVPVKNWSNVSETFTVMIDSVKLSLPAFYKIMTQDTISIPPKQTRKCRIEIICYKECCMDFQVLVKNTSSKEYLVYAVTATITSPDVVMVKLATPLAVPCKHRICLKNPMEKKTIFNFKSPHQDIKPSHKILQVGSLSKRYLTLKYIPTGPRKSEEIVIDIYNDLLGKSAFKLLVSTLEPVAENVTEVKTPLGTSKTFTITVKNPHRQVVLFIFEADSKNLFTKNSSFIIGPRKKTNVKVVYEPSSLGNHLMNVTMKTNGFGEFLYPIKGLSCPPEPQGPLIIPKFEQYEFAFKNVLSTAEDFFLSVNNDQFTISKNRLLIPPKERKTIFIKFKEDPNLEIIKDIPPTGKLRIICTQHIPHIQWDYYLKAI